MIISSYLHLASYFIIIIYLLGFSYIDQKWLNYLYQNDTIKIILLLVIMSIYYKNKHLGSVCLGLLIITYMRTKYEYFRVENDGVGFSQRKHSIQENFQDKGDIPVQNYSRPEVIPESNYQSLDSLKAFQFDCNFDDQRNQKILMSRLESLTKNNEITPLEKNIIFEIQKSFGLDLDILRTNDLKKISKYTDEGDPMSVGLPNPVDQSVLEYDKLVQENKIIDF